MMTPPPTTSAVAEVIQTPELLEQILSYLSIDRLLVVKRVSWRWHTMISTSPELQRTLFQRADASRAKRDHNPLFEDFFTEIGCVEEAVPASRKGTGVEERTAHLKISPINMRRLLNRCPKSLRTMNMFQPPCRYYLTMPSASVYDINVRFVNDPHVPVMQAVEKANLIVELEADKKRNMRRNLERQLMLNVGGARARQRAAINA